MFVVVMPCGTECDVVVVMLCGTESDVCGCYAVWN